MSMRCVGRGMSLGRALHWASKDGKFETFKYLKTVFHVEGATWPMIGIGWVCTESRKKLDLIGIAFLWSKTMGNRTRQAYLDDFDTILKYKLIQQEMGSHTGILTEAILTLRGYFLLAVQCCAIASRSFFSYRNRTAQTWSSISPYYQPTPVCVIFTGPALGSWFQAVPGMSTPTNSVGL